MNRLKRELTGSGSVLRFTFVQLFKARGNIITLGIFMLLALVSVPAMSLFSAGGEAAPAPEPDYEYAAHAPEESGGSLSVSYSVVRHSEYLGGGDSGADGYLVQLVYSVLVMMVSVMSVSYIVGAVAEEKTSKLVELLMVSVKPLALIVGKILSVMLYMLVSFGLIALCFALSGALSSLLFKSSAAIFAVPASLLGGIGALDVLAALVSLLLGYLTFAIAAGLFGAGCSGTEDIQGAAGGCTVLIMLAYVVSIAAGSVGGAFGTVCSLVPVLSVFCAPARYAVGALSLPLLCLSWVIQAVCVALLALLCARVYAALLIYRGGRVRLGQMLRMARGGGEAV